MAQILLFIPADFSAPITSVTVQVFTFAHSIDAACPFFDRVDFLPTFRAAEPYKAIYLFYQSFIAPIVGILTTPVPSSDSTVILATSAIHGSVFRLFASIFA